MKRKIFLSHLDTDCGKDKSTCLCLMVNMQDQNCLFC